MKTTTRVLLAALLCTAAVACSKKVKEEPPADTGPSTGTVAPTGPATAGAYTPADLDSDACLRQRVVYFDLDQDTLRPEFQAIIACHAKYLRDRNSSRISLEGHADERGSREYNQGLGERRGNGVSSALQANGGSAAQLAVVSYGEERPVCTESNEDCWARNRRVEIIYTAR
ncbi:peptidoglycan-associated lipoprotein Pal [Luteimonas sp. BDR2-5]|uniref:peptidoglycan-associated lipoprotein Pal n=1 Tax=Proluteimonas luteida TaxID=2878685 RepID=UPI001E2D57E0|nr:peptidoglycan-associated lipoprotein Pal [Luteimonas sp. BDR2-5]MCD9027443.1 peptidoglycan-associated lipoprotein Pal [Luteimonas sp. BDR2-5]